MIILLAGSVFLDPLFYRLEKWDHNLNQPGIPFWTELPVYVVFALLLLGLAWVVLIASPRSLWGAFIFIAVGLSGLALITRFGLFSIRPLIDLPMPCLSTALSSPLALARQHSAAFILVIGLVRQLPEKLLRPRSNRSMQTGDLERFVSNTFSGNGSRRKPIKCISAGVMGWIIFGLLIAACG